MTLWVIEIDFHVEIYQKYSVQILTVDKMVDGQFCKTTDVTRIHNSSFNRSRLLFLDMRNIGSEERLLFLAHARLSVRTCIFIMQELHFKMTRFDAWFDYRAVKNVTAKMTK